MKRKALYLTAMLITLCMLIMACAKKPEINQNPGTDTTVPTEAVAATSEPLVTSAPTEAAPEPTVNPTVEPTQEPIPEPTAEPEPVLEPNLINIGNPVGDYLAENGFDDDFTGGWMLRDLELTRASGAFSFNMNGASINKQVSALMLDAAMIPFYYRSFRTVQYCNEYPAEDYSFTCYSDKVGMELRFSFTDKYVYIFNANDAEPDLLAVLEVSEPFGGSLSSAFMTVEDLRELAVSINYEAWDGSLRLETLKGYLIDLDEDGKLEEVMAAYPMYEYGYGAFRGGVHIFVDGGLLYSEEYAGEPVTECIYVTDLDKQRPGVNLFAMDNGPSDDPVTNFFAYSSYMGGELELIGNVPCFFVTGNAYMNAKLTDGAIPGDGTLSGSKRLSVLQTWYAPAKWMLDEGGYIVDDESVLYYPTNGTEVTLLYTLKLYPDFNDLSVTEEIAPGPVKLVATDDRTIVSMIDPETGKGGWLFLDTWQSQVVGDAPDGWGAYELFDGLCFVD